MSNVSERFQAAQQKAIANRPKANGFPYLAELEKCAVAYDGANAETYVEPYPEVTV